VSVCVHECGGREPCTVFGFVPSLILASFLCAKSRAARAPVGRSALARPSGSTPATQHTAHSPRSLEHQYQLAAQTAIKWLSKLNRCHLSHIREDTGQPCVPVQEFNLIACSPSLPGPELNPQLGRCAPWLVV